MTNYEKLYSILYTQVASCLLGIETERNKLREVMESLERVIEEDRIRLTGNINIKRNEMATQLLGRIYNERYYKKQKNLDK